MSLAPDSSDFSLHKDPFGNLTTGFVGRQAELQKIEKYFSTDPSDGARIRIIHGDPGEGKTRLAMEYGVRSKCLYSYTIWLNAESDIAAIHGFATVAADLGGEYTWHDLIDATTSKIVKFVLDKMNSWQRRWLLVFDGYDRPEVFPDIKRLIPMGAKVDVIFTTRSTQLSGIGEVLELPALTDAESLQLLLGGYEPQDVEEHKSKWVEVLPRLGNFALSLSQAAAYLKCCHIPICQPEELMAAYDVKKDLITNRLADDLWDPNFAALESTVKDRLIAAYATWEMVLERMVMIDGHPEDAVRHFLAVLAFLGPEQNDDVIFRLNFHNVEHLWVRVFASRTEDTRHDRDKAGKAIEVDGGEVDGGDHVAKRSSTDSDGYPVNDTPEWDFKRFWSCVRRLRELSILCSVWGDRPEHYRFQLHPLIRAWARLRLPPDQRQAYTIEAIQLVHHAAFSLFSTTISAFAYQKLALVLQIDACKRNDDRFVHADHRLGLQEYNCHIADYFVHFYKTPGRFKHAQELALKVLETRKRILGTDHPMTLHSMNDIAEIYIQLGRWGEAEDAIKQVIARQWNNLARDNTAISVKIRGMRWLVLLYMRQKHFVNAEKASLDLIEQIKTHSGDDGFDMAIAKETLASIYLTQHKFKESIELGRSALEIHSAILGDNHTATLKCKRQLARILAMDGQREEAELLDEEVKMGNLEIAFGEQHWSNDVRNFKSLEDDPREHFEGFLKHPQNWRTSAYSDTERIRNIILASRGNLETHPAELWEQSSPPVAVFAKQTAGPHSEINYTRLNPDELEIRLLTLYPGSFDDEIRLDLVAVSLRSHPTYTALSYCWGDQKGLGGIYVDGKRVDVTDSLKIALKYARKTGNKVVMWADAICINQNDPDEKSSQVRVMSKIYGSATDVRIWLGKSADNSDAAMDFLNNMNEADFGKPGFEDIWIALSHLQARPWWSRIWVVQEALFAKRLKFYCGWKSADIEHFTRFHDIKTRYKKAAKRESRFEAMELAVTSPFNGILLDWDRTQQIIANGGHHLMHLVSMLNDSQSTEPRDKVFALLSMSREVDRRVIQIDYRVSLPWLMTKVCKYGLIERDAFSPLALLQTTRSHKNPLLPSWVPDYTKSEDEDKLWTPLGNYKAAANNAAWLALGEAPLVPVVTDQFSSMNVVIEDEGTYETLVLCGMVVDVVESAFRTPWVKLYDRFDVKEDREIKAERRSKIVHACKEWEEYVGGFPAEKSPYSQLGERYEAFWRTLIADADNTWRGNKPSEEDNFAGRFEAWMGGDKERALDEDFIRPFNQAAIQRLMQRSFIFTSRGYYGLGSCYPRPLDLVCVLRGGDVPFILRPRLDEYYEWVGEAYLHGIMDGSFVRSATPQQLRQFKIR